MKNKSSQTNAVTGTELLQVAFIVLKLCGVIKWSWLWVLAPTWIMAILVVIVIVLFAIFQR